MKKIKKLINSWGTCQDGNLSYIHQDKNLWTDAKRKPLARTTQNINSDTSHSHLTLWILRSTFSGIRKNCTHREFPSKCCTSSFITPSRLQPCKKWGKYIWRKEKETEKRPSEREDRPASNNDNSLSYLLCSIPTFNLNGKIILKHVTRYEGKLLPQRKFCHQ